MAQRLTREQFHEWAGARKGRYERVAGEPVAMSPERIQHARIKSRVWAALDHAIRHAIRHCAPGHAVDGEHEERATLLDARAQHRAARRLVRDAPRVELLAHRANGCVVPGQRDRGRAAVGMRDVRMDSDEHHDGEIASHGTSWVAVRDRILR